MRLEPMDDFWVMRRMGYSEAENPQHMGVIISSKSGMMLGTFQSKHLACCIGKGHLIFTLARRAETECLVAFGVAWTAKRSVKLATPRKRWFHKPGPFICRGCPMGNMVLGTGQGEHRGTVQGHKCPQPTNAA